MWSLYSQLFTNSLICSERKRLRPAQKAQAAVTSALSTTKRSYPTSEVRGSGRECQAVMAQEQPR